ncbi:beta strand repeat-containing protein [Haloferula rosea]|uniref:Autotransporter-associated beta strand repeat-containing protein n=1 Tax=Haloferula rosea TaxID=490093 RepID=A0A934R9X8_9BACT|nr:autotransporter-associated beta strand repeat-containing protein [Haloferula rosea]MBK1825762.1 autotransporter-associated beta strand repeat-containing protein [Haloferula rosea]
MKRDQNFQRSCLLRSALHTSFSYCPAACALAAVAVVNTASAAPLYWDTNDLTPGSGNASADWDTGTNWSTAAAGDIATTGWTDSETAVFSAGTDGTNFTATVTTAVDPAGITIEEAGNTVTLAGGTIDIGADTIDSSALGAASNRNVVISSALIGTGGLTIASHGSLADSGGGSNSEIDLAGTNTFSGDLTITAGLVAWTNDDSFGNAANKIVLDGGGLLDPNRALTLTRDLEVATTGYYRVYGSVDSTLTGSLSGAGDLTKTDGGVLNIESTANSGFTGSVIVGGGFLRLADETSIGDTPAVATADSIILKNGSKLQGGTSAGGGDLTISANRGITISSGNSGFHTITGSTTTVESPIVGPGSLSKTNGGTVILNGDINVTGELRAEGGILDVRSAASSITTTRVRNGTSVLNIGTGANISTSRFVSADSSGAQSTINQTGGTLNITGTLNNSNQNSSYVMGHWGNGGATSAFNLSGGTINSPDAELKFGWDSNDVTFVQSGGDHLILGLDFNSGRNNTAVYSLNGGNLGIGASGISAASNKVLDLGGGTITALDDSDWAGRMTTQTATTSTFDVDGYFVDIIGNITGDGTIDLISTAGGGGFTFFTNGTQNIEATLTGDADLFKDGTGTTVLSGASGSSTSVLSVFGGTLQLDGGFGGSIEATDLGAFAGDGTIGGDLTLGGGSTGTTLQIPATGGPSAAGNVELIGTTTVELTDALIGVNPTVPVFNYGTLTGDPTTQLSFPGGAGYRGAVFSDDVGNSRVLLTITNEDLTWTGGTDGTWDQNSSVNWLNGGANTFYDQDLVTFDDSGANPAITLVGELQPGSMVVDTDSATYSITGSAGNFISGLGSLLKTGSSVLAMDAPNTYTGGSVISEGSILVRQAGALGAGTITLGDSNTGASDVALYLDTNRINFGTPVVISGEGTGTATLGSQASVTGSGNNNRFSNITLEGDVILDSNASDRTDYDNITGTGDVTVTGAGRTIFQTSPALWVGDLTISTTGPGGLQLGTVAGAGDRIPDTSNVTISSGAFLRLSTASETVGALSGSGTINTNSPGGGTAVLSIGAGDADGNFSGLLENAGGVLALTKVGAGTQTITGTNTYTGKTAINGGILEVDGVDVFGPIPGVATADQISFNGGIIKTIGSFDFDIANRGITTTAPGGGGFNIPLGETVNVTSPVVGDGSITKSGEGLMVSSGGTWTGGITVEEGTLRMNGKTGNSDYTIKPGAILEMDYSRTSAYDHGMTIEGSGVASTSGLYLGSGRNLNFQRNGGLKLTTAPTTIRTFGGGSATLSGFDINSVHLNVNPDASGSVIPSDVNINSGGFGYRSIVAAGANTATGDLIIDSVISGNGSVERGGIQVNFWKSGAGSILLNGASTSAEGIWIIDGSLILGADERIADTAGLILGDGGTSSTLVLNGFSETVADIGGHNGNIGSSIIGGAASESTLIVNYNGGGRTFEGFIGGPGVNEGNLALVKSGTGTLTLNGLLDYQGSTTVSDGVLSLSFPDLDDGADVNINTTGVIDLAHGASDTINALFFDGVLQAAGTWGATGSGAANIDDSRFTGTGVLDVTTGAVGTPYDLWETANGIAGAGRDVDSDGDGVENGIEFVIGGDPNGADSNSLLPTVVVDATDLVFTFRQTQDSAGEDVFVEYGTNLTGWTEAEAGEPVGPNPVTIATTTDGFAPGVDRVEVTIPRALFGGGETGFARLVNEAPAP